MRLLKPLLFIAGCAAAASAFADGEQRFVDTGDLKLQSGATLTNCRVGYRTFGKLSPRKDNAILVPTWFLGTTKDLAGNFRKGGLADPAKYFIIAVDALGDGVSTSPSNSPTQGEANFPRITIRDMVESQHTMLLKLGLNHIHAVMGISMGGMQTFQWITAYPQFMDVAIPIVGSPQPTSYDLMFYAGSLKAVKAAIANPSAAKPLIESYADFFWLALNSPRFYVEHTKREGAVASLDGFEKAILAWNPYDIVAGLDALMTQDIYKPFGGSVSKAAKAIKAKVLVIVASEDHCVNLVPALSLAKQIDAKTIILTGNEGHSSPGASMIIISPEIAKLLRKHS